MRWNKRSRTGEDGTCLHSATLLSQLFEMALKFVGSVFPRKNVEWDSDQTPSQSFHNLWRCTVTSQSILLFIAVANVFIQYLPARWQGPTACTAALAIPQRIRRRKRARMVDCRSSYHRTDNSVAIIFSKQSLIDDSLDLIQISNLAVGNKLVLPEFVCQSIDDIGPKRWDCSVLNGCLSGSSSCSLLFSLVINFSNALRLWEATIGPRNPKTLVRPFIL
mmetsp:Transcript_27818/g.80333  ORF Transcript_27818/g.80333 Transcript_27818/m.80333 type:complete len:220 (+) Transcript_27818:1339-1998(+)